MLAAISATHAFVMSALITRISKLKEEHLEVSFIALAID